MDPTPTSSSTPPPSGGFLPPGAMDFSTTGVPWVDFLIDAVVVAGLVSAGIYAFYALHLKPILAKIAKNAATAADMTANSHGATANPNLRDDMDAKHQTLLEQNQKILANQELQGRLIEEVARSQVRQDKELARIQEVQNEDRKATNRVREALDEHVREKRDFAPRLTSVEHELKSHRMKTEDP